MKSELIIELLLMEILGLSTWTFMDAFMDELELTTKDRMIVSLPTLIIVLCIIYFNY